MNDDALKSMKVKTRRAKALRVSHFKKGPQGESDAQRGKLWALLGRPTPGEMEAYVRFANGYTHERLTRVHWVHAITLAIEKVNAFGFYWELLELSQDPDFVCEPKTGEFKRRMIARAKASKFERYASPKARSKSETPGSGLNSSEARSSGDSLAALARAREAQSRGALELLAKSRKR